MKELFKKMKGRSPATKKISSDEGGGSNGGSGSGRVGRKSGSNLKEPFPETSNEGLFKTKGESYADQNGATYRIDKNNRRDYSESEIPPLVHYRTGKPPVIRHESPPPLPDQGRSAKGRTYTEPDGSTYRLDKNNQRNYSESDLPPPIPRVIKEDRAFKEMMRMRHMESKKKD